MHLIVLYYHVYIYIYIYLNHIHDLRSYVYCIYTVYDPGLQSPMSRVCYSKSSIGTITSTVSNIATGSSSSSSSSTTTTTSTSTRTVIIISSSSYRHRHRHRRHRRRPHHHHHHHHHHSPPWSTIQKKILKSSTTPQKKTPPLLNALNSFFGSTPPSLPPPPVDTPLPPFIAPRDCRVFEVKLVIFAVNSLLRWRSWPRIGPSGPRSQELHENHGGERYWWPCWPNLHTNYGDLLYIIIAFKWSIYKTWSSKDAEGNGWPLRAWLS